jgi:hypothetical protein
MIVHIFSRSIRRVTYRCISYRTRLAGSGGGFAVPEEGLVARIGPEDLIALRVVAGLGLSDRAGTNDLSFPHRLAPEFGWQKIPS